MPLSLTAILTKPSLRVASRRTQPTCVNFTAFESRLSRICLSFVRSVYRRMPSSPTRYVTSRPFFRTIGSELLRDLDDDFAERNVFKVQRHLPRLDLGEVEDVVDERLQVLPRRADALEAVDLLHRHLAEQTVEEQ